MENMMVGTTEYATTKADRVRALEIGGRIDGETGRPIYGGGLVALHSLLSRGEEDFGNGRDIVGGNGAGRDRCCGADQGSDSSRERGSNGGRCML